MICGIHYFTTKLKTKIDLLVLSRFNICDIHIKLCQIGEPLLCEFSEGCTLKNFYHAGGARDYSGRQASLAFDIYPDIRTAPCVS